jgi:hypothetical protein
MRASILAALMVAGLLANGKSIFAGEGCGVDSGACNCGSENGDPCACGRWGCGLLGHKCGCPIEGLDRWANCGCNGSYNYPVPPLYTYHWPGMYKQARMTDYHSPWRFPPLKRYEDEPLPTIQAPARKAAASIPSLRPVSLQRVPESFDR